MIWLAIILVLFAALSALVEYEVIETSDLEPGVGTVAFTWKPISLLVLATFLVSLSSYFDYLYYDFIF